MIFRKLYLSFSKMPRLYPLLLTLSVFVLAGSVQAGEPPGIDLSGSWYFAIDPMGVGELRDWHLPDEEAESLLGSTLHWDVVNVPHTWSTDPRYRYTGAAWYRRTITLPDDLKNQHIRLAFEGVFYRTRVWINGIYAGKHEGGYTPFTLDITDAVRIGEENLIVVEVDNTLDLTTIPGLRPGSSPHQQVMPWWEYGGIFRDVYILASPHVFVENQKIVATPDLERGTADLDVTVWITNTTNQVKTGLVTLELRREGKDEVIASADDRQELRANFRLMPFSTEPVRLQTTLPEQKVTLWHIDRPELYEMAASVRDDSPASGVPAEHTHRANFGIRKVEIAGARLLLNGEPVRMGGANRHIDHPTLGLHEPDSLVNLDLSLMKQANMELQRLHHYPPSSAVYEWADRNGMLIIAEAGNWQLTPEQMDDPVMRARWQSQTREMIQRDWNHPSVIGWSVGNEYLSETPAGLRWTRDMSRFIKTLDDTRFVTYAAYGSVLNDSDVPPEARGPAYVDLISVNLYSSPEGAGAALDRAHAWWPNKPILISEWGRRADAVKQESERSEFNRKYIDAIRKREYVIGASIWTYNDYSSRFPGTNPDGYRPWGAVDKNRQPRESYYVLREDFSPAILGGEVRVDGNGMVAGRFHITARNDFPRYTLRDYTARFQVLDRDGRVLHEDARPIRVLEPGERVDLNFTIQADQIQGADRVSLTLVRPTGFSTTDRTWTLQRSGSTNQTAR